MTRNFVLAFLLLTLSAVNAGAATIFGRVIAVSDGDVITVFNLNRPVRIKLLAVDAPESDQAFGEVAKKHLNDLVYEKSVLVEYSGIAPDGSLVGRVTLNGADIGAQMIRDGAAWFDASGQDRLSAADREVYQQSEQAARSEKRGLWQAENPMAPWEFVRAKTLKRDSAANLNSVLPATKARVNQPRAELTNLTLFAQPAGSNKNYFDTGWGLQKHWQLYKPAGENFSALMPDDGLEKSVSVPFNGRTVEMGVYAAHADWSIYVLIWAKGPSYGESDSVAIHHSLNSFLQAFNESVIDASGQPGCQLENESRFSAGEYSGSDYDLRSCSLPMKLRAFTKAEGADRQIYMGVALRSGPEDENVSKFINSFTVTGSGPKNTKRSLTKARR